MRLPVTSQAEVVRRQWTWSDRHMDAVRRVILDHAGLFVDLVVASLSLDQLDASDLVMTASGRGRFGVRIRRRWYVDRRGRVHRDMTLRTRSDGHRSEHDKVRDGAGDWAFFGVSDGADGLADWFVVDLDAFRASGLLDTPMDRKDNGDGTGFMAWPADVLTAGGCVVVDALAVTMSSASWPATVATRAGTDGGCTWS